MAKTISFRINPIRVNDAIDRFTKHLETDDTAENTMKRYGTDMKRLRRAAGKLYVHEVTPEHIDKVFAEHAAKGNGLGTRNNTVTNLRVFFKWCARNKYMSPFDFDNPMDGRKRKRYEKEHPPPIAHEHWPMLLDMAGDRHPLHRAFWALGLYTFARASEILPLRMWDLKLTGSRWTVDIERTKTKLAADAFAIAPELCEEITRWLTWYNQWAIEQHGVPIRRDWYVIPRMRAWRGFEGFSITPDLPRNSSNVGQIVKPVLIEYGYPVTDENGKANYWAGAHALRRSGARAWYNELRQSEKGRDLALRVVQAALGHLTQAQTEAYLGLNPDREFRNELLWDGYMFASNDPNAAEKDGTPRLHSVPQIDTEAAVAALPSFLRAA